MNVRFRSSYTIFANTFLQKYLQANRYQIVVDFLIHSEDADEYNIAVDRASYFMHALCSNAIFVKEDDIEKFPELDNMGCDVIVLPEEPNDQIIGLMVFCKLNAIMEGRVSVTDVSIKSHVGLDYEYLHNEEEFIGPFEDSGWWNDSDVGIRNTEDMSDENREIYLESLPEWSTIGLDWGGDIPSPELRNVHGPGKSAKKSKKETDTNSGNVVFVDFDKNKKN